MCKMLDKKLNRKFASYLPASVAGPIPRPYLAFQGRGNDAVLVFVDGQKRVSTGVKLKALSPRARERLKRKVFASHLRIAADEFVRSDDPK